MSLRAVATSVGVSASLISQVETGKTQPSVSTLYALVNHLGISFDDLLGASVGDAAPAQASASRVSGTGTTSSTAGGLSTPRATSGPNGTAGSAPVNVGTSTAIQRSADNPSLEMENGVRWERLAAGHGSPVDPLLVTYEPGASSSVEGKLMRHSGIEYAYLLSGTLTVHVDFDEYVIHAGDSLNFDSVRPHMYVNHGSVPAQGLWFVIGRNDNSQTPHVSTAQGGETTTPLNSAVDVLQAMDKLA